MKRTNRWSQWVLAVPLALLVLACGGDVEPEPEAVGEAVEAAFPLEDCHLSMEGSTDRVAARCGTLTVPEDRENPQGRQIDLKVAVLEAVSREPAPDPLFLLAGGPGQAATEAFLPMLPLLRDIRQERDLVLVDQRGTGESHPLECEPDEENALDAFTIPAGDEMREELEACLAELDADPRLYTTVHAMADLDAVREALGYEQINLYGVSYGTRAAQTYVQLYPERTRAVILDGVVPQDLAIGITWARDAQRAVDLLFERCDATPACTEAFPDLEGDLRNLLASLEEPQPVSLRHPVSGEEMRVELGREHVASIIQRFSYAPETSSLLPLLIHRAATEGDLAALAAQGVLAAQVGGGMAMGMTLSVICAENQDRLDTEEADALAENTYYGDLQLRILRQACAVWPRGDVPESFFEPLQSDVPTLLLSGEADPVTPPEYGEEVAEGLSNSLHVVVPGLGHNVLPRGCLPKVAETFLETGTVEGLEVDCAQDIEPLPFFLTPSGPAP